MGIQYIIDADGVEENEIDDDLVFAIEDLESAVREGTAREVADLAELASLLSEYDLSYLVHHCTPQYFRDPNCFYGPRYSRIMRREGRIYLSNMDTDRWQWTDLRMFENDAHFIACAKLDGRMFLIPSADTELPMCWFLPRNDEDYRMFGVPAGTDPATLPDGAERYELDRRWLIGALRSTVGIPPETEEQNKLSYICMEFGPEGQCSVVGLNQHCISWHRGRYAGEGKEQQVPVHAYAAEDMLRMIERMSCASVTLCVGDCIYLCCDEQPIGRCKREDFAFPDYRRFFGQPGEGAIRFDAREVAEKWAMEYKGFLRCTVNLGKLTMQLLEGPERSLTVPCEYHTHVPGRFGLQPVFFARMLRTVGAGEVELFMGDPTKLFVLRAASDSPYPEGEHLTALMPMILSDK